MARVPEALIYVIHPPTIASLQEGSSRQANQEAPLCQGGKCWNQELQLEDGNRELQLDYQIRSLKRMLGRTHVVRRSRMITGRGRITSVCQRDGERSFLLPCSSQPFQSVRDLSRYAERVFAPAIGMNRCPKVKNLAYFMLIKLQFSTVLLAKYTGMWM